MPPPLPPITSTTAPPVIKPRPYRRYLTSAFHTRFVHAASITFIVALDTAIWTGPNRGYFWSWFPIGPAGLRALLYFMASLFIFTLQIATLTIGKPTSISPFQRVRTISLSLGAMQTLFWYLISAWWFTEVYIWSTPSLGWIIRGNRSTPDKLNERPIYMRAFFLQLAIIQAGIHMYLGHSSLHIPISVAPTPQTNDHRTHLVLPGHIHLQRKIVPIIIRVGVVSGVMTLMSPLVYGIFMRQLFWQVHLAMAKPFFNLSRVNAHATGVPPLLGLLPTTFMVGALLLFTWEISTLLFLTYMQQAPTQKGIPLSGTSRDPNGTLLNGLKAKRDIVKTFAFWELVVIAQQQPERRRAIFADIERVTGPIWTQMLEEALKVVQTIDLRITGPIITPAAAEPPTIETLPKILPQISNNIVTAGKSKHRLLSVGTISEEAQMLGTNPHPWRGPSESAARLLEYSTSAGLDASRGPWEHSITAFKASPLGFLFGSRNNLKISANVLGSPYGNAAIIVDAVEGVTKMLVASLAEDTYGKAMAGVPTSVKAFTKTVNLIEGLIQKNQEGLSDLGEVGIVLNRLKASLRELLSAFQMYLNDVGLGIGELNEAKKAAEPKDLLRAQNQETAPNPTSQAKESTTQNTRRRNEETQQEQPRPTQRQQEPQAQKQRSQKQRLPSQETNSRKDWNGMNGRPDERRREMEMVR